MYRSGDPIEDFHRYENDRYRALRDRPFCHDCDEPVGEWYYEVYGLFFCEDCMREHLHAAEDS